MILKVYIDQMTDLYKDLAESLKPKDVDHPHFQEAMDDLHFSLYNLDVLCDVLKRKQEEAELSPEEEALLLEKQFIEESVAQEPVVEEFPPSEVPEPVYIAPEEGEDLAPLPKVKSRPKDKGVLSEFTWYRDDTINGDPRDILHWIYKTNESRAKGQTLLKVLMLARKQVDNKPKSLNMEETADILMRIGVKGVQNTMLAHKQYIRTQKKLLRTFRSDKTALGRVFQQFPVNAYYRHDHIQSVVSFGGAF